MDCRKYGILISAYADNELRGSELESLENHLETCDKCRKELESIRKTGQLLAQREKAVPEPFFETRLSARIGSTGRTGYLLRGYAGLLRKAVPAFILVSLVITGIYMRVPSCRAENDDYLFLADTIYTQEEGESFAEDIMNICFGEG